MQVLQTCALATSPPAPSKLIAGQSTLEPRFLTAKNEKPTEPCGGWVVGKEVSVWNLARCTRPRATALTAAATHHGIDQPDHEIFINAIEALQHARVSAD